MYLTEPCFRAEDRELAQDFTYNSIENMVTQGKDSSKGLCMNPRPPPNDPRRPRYLVAFNEKRLAYEKSLYKALTSDVNKDLKTYIWDLLGEVTLTLTLT
jgi:hypothetical protein